MLFDAHCHFSDRAYDDIRTELAEAIKASELGLLIDTATNLEEAKRVLENTRKYSFCYGAAGIYPGETECASEEELREITELYRNEEKIVAIGEIGLDYHYEDNPPRELQQYWFRRQLDAAIELGAPVVIHTRDAAEDTMRILKESGAFGRIGVMLHDYSGSAELAEQYVKLGAVLSIAGIVTFKNNRKTVETVARTGLEHLHIETDSPYLTPVPFRGQRNMPHYVEHTARKIAEIKGISYEEVADATFRNACGFFGIKI